MAKIVLHCSNPVGKRMSGPAIRCWEIAKCLSKTHEVHLSTPNFPDISSDRFLIQPRNQIPLSKLIPAADFLLTQCVTPHMAWLSKKAGTRILLDAYDPLPFENLEIFNSAPKWVQNYKNKRIINSALFSFQMADAILCASSRQRDLWTGLLLSLGKIDPEIYHRDKSLKNLISIVPFGMPSVPPGKTGEGFRKQFKLPEDAKVLLWGGGIWNWFDPLTLIKAVKKLKEENYPVYLVFMGLNPSNCPPNEMAVQALKLSEDLDLKNRNVFFNEWWIPYEERQNFLLEADIGVSTHFEHLETHFSFRTRLLDYLWAGLPILTTEGDCLSKFIEEKELGYVVPYKDIEEMARGIRKLLDPNKRTKIRDNIAKVRREYEWKNVVIPLMTMIEELSKIPKPTLCGRDLWQIARSLIKKYAPQDIVRELLFRNLDPDRKNINQIKLLIICFANK